MDTVATRELTLPTSGQRPLAPLCSSRGGRDRRTADAGQVWAVVLAGGDGTRVSAFTRTSTGEPVPKQYHAFGSEESLLRRAVRRAAGVVVCRPGHQDVVPGTRERIIPDSQARVAEAFCAALGVYHWRTKVGSGDRNHIFDSGLPESRFLDIPGFETMASELEAIHNSQWFYYDQMSGPLRDQVVDYMKQRFLLTLNQKRKSGESMNVTLMANNATAIDLTRQKVAVIKFTHSEDFPSTDRFLSEIFYDISYTERARTFRWVSQTPNDRLNLTVDGVRRDMMPYLYGGEWSVFLRSFFGKPFNPLPGFSPDSIPDPNPSDPGEIASFSSDITTGYATILCPPELQPTEIQQYCAALFLPATTVGYSCTRPYPDQQSAVNFVRRAQ